MDGLNEEQFHATSPEPLMLLDGELRSFFDPTKQQTDDSSSQQTSLPPGQQDFELDNPPPQMIVDLELFDPEPCDSNASTLPIDDRDSDSLYPQCHPASTE